DECVLPEQPPDLHGRAGRWLPGVDVLVADLADHWQMGGVEQVDVELDDLLEAGSDRLEGGAEVVEHLTGLGADVAGADKRPRRVQGDLAVADAGLAGPGWHLVEGVVFRAGVMAEWLRVRRSRGAGSFRAEVRTSDRGRGLASGGPAAW